MASGPFAALHWQRLCVELINIRTMQNMKAHPVSVIQAIIMGVTHRLADGSLPSINHSDLCNDDSLVFHIKDRKHAWRMNIGDAICVEILFFRRTLEYIERWKQALVVYLSNPETGKNFKITSLGAIEERSYEKLRQENSAIVGEREVYLEFLMPLPFNGEPGKYRSYLARHELIEVFTGRYKRLFGKELVYSQGEDNFEIEPFYWTPPKKIKHLSRSQPGQTQQLKGCVGILCLKGNFERFLPYLILGSEFHVGRKLSNSQGYYRLRKEAVTCFDSFLLCRSIDCPGHARCVRTIVFDNRRFIDKRRVS